jgi:hypothetical protein
MSSVRVNNVAGTIRMLSIDADKIEKAAIYALSQVAFEVERQAKLNASGPVRKRYANGKTEPERHVNWAGGGPNGPNVISGSLRRSIHTEVRRIGFGDYIATVSPTMIYARAVELGNPRWKGGVKYPYLIPAANSVRPRMNQIFMTAYMRKRQR